MTPFANGGGLLVGLVVGGVSRLIGIGGHYPRSDLLLRHVADQSAGNFNRNTALANWDLRILDV